MEGQRVKIFFLATAMLALFTAPALAQDGTLKLTLKEAIRLAVEKNLDVQAALYTPASAEADIYKNLGIYNPLLSLQANYQDSTTLSSYSFITGGEPVGRQRSTTYNSGVSQLVPTGGTIGAAFDNSWNHENFGISNYFQSDVTMTFTQPLLKSFGRENTEININVARFSREGALEQFKAKLLPGEEPVLPALQPAQEPGGEADLAQPG
jgi:outer membrane protein TolC